MPPNKSRRLPGGKVRRPEGRAARVPGAAEPRLIPEEPDEPEEIDASDTAVTLEDYRVSRPDPEPVPVSSASRRVRERRARSQTVKGGPSQMDLAAQNYRHVGGDLLRIAIIAAVMFGIIVALSFVIK